MTAHEFFTRVGDMLIDRDHGTLHFRVFMQPLVAIILAIRVGVRDAREGRPAYFFWPIFTNKALRAELIRQARRDVGKVFIAAFVLDVIYELIVWRWVYPTQAMLVAMVLAIIPYLLVRGPVTRMARRFVQKDATTDDTKR